MIFSSLFLLICDMTFPREIDIDRIEYLSLKPIRPNQLSQSMFGFHMQDRFEFTRRISRFRSFDQGLGGIQQISKPRKPNCTVMPQPHGIKPSNRSQRIVFAPMRIAAQILQLGQLTKDRTASRIVQFCLNLVKGRDFMGFKELLDDLYGIFCRVHNETISPYKNICQGQWSQKAAISENIHIKGYRLHWLTSWTFHYDTVGPTKCSFIFA